MKLFSVKGKVEMLYDDWQPFFREEGIHLTERFLSLIK